MAGFGGAVKLTGEEAYRSALKKITQNLKEVASEMKLVSSQYDKGDKSEAALSKQTEVLNKALAEQKKKFDTIKAAYDKFEPQVQKMRDEHAELVKEYEKEKQKLSEIESTLGKSSKEYKDQAKAVEDLSKKVDDSAKANDAAEKTLSEMRVEMNKTQAQSNKTAKDIENLGKDTEDAGEKAEKAASGGFTVFKGVVADLTATAIKKALEGLKELGSKLIDIGKQSFGNFANYEQVVGGVETLFKESAKEVEGYAEEAYRTAGISANEYMQQVTSFSATLLQGLDGDTAKAAKYADQAIRDMSDNANKFGSDMSAIQNAYQGFAKDNYTMLDNLKLGYGGTASEMARLINDSGVLGDSVEVTANTVKDIPFSSIIDAIHKVQENLGVTGTTAKEASSTIEGSGNAVKASWENMLTAVAGGKSGAEKATQTLIENVKTYLNNAIPVIKRIVSNLASTVMSTLKTYAPGVAKVLEGVANVVKGLFNFVKDNWRTIVSALAAIAAGLVAFKIASVISATVSAISGFITAIKTAESVTSAFTASFAANPFALIAAGLAAVIAAIAIFNSSAESAEERVERLAGAQHELVTAALETADSFYEARDAAAEQAETQIANVDYVEKKLLPQLKDVIDANGAVKRGEEERAKYILGELNEALGTEYEDLSAIVDANGNIKDSIYDVIAARKAQIYLNAYEDSFAEALKNQETAYEDVAQAAADLSTAQQAYADRRAEIANNPLWKNKSDEEIQRLVDFQLALNDEKEAWEDTIREKQNAYNKAVDAAGEYSDTIIRYSAAQEAALAGDNAKAVELLSIYGNAFKTAVSVQGRAAEDQQRILGEQAVRLEAAYKIMVANHEKSWNSMTEEERTQAKEQERIALERANSAKEEFRKVGGTMIAEMRNGVATGSYKFTAEMQDSVTKAVTAAKNAGNDAYNIGANIAGGLTSGYNSAVASFYNAIDTSSNYAKYKMEQIWGISSPSKYMRQIGKYIVQGEVLGVEDEQKHLNDALKGLGHDSQASLVSGMTSQTAMRSTAKQNEVGMVAAFKEALAEMKIELDDRVAGKFVERTVARAIY